MFKVIDVVKDLVLTTDNSIKITKVNDLGGNLYELVTCDYKHVNKCNTISIDSTTYTIKDYSDNGLIVESQTLPITGDYTISNITFIHGTYTDANKAMLLMDEEGEKFDNIAFFVSTPLREIVNLDPLKSLFTTVEVQLLLLSSNNIHDWCPDDHYNNAIYPMRNYADLILKNVDNRRIDFERTDKADILNLIDVGIYKDKSGSEVSLFDYTYSGVLLSFDLGIRKGHKCCKNK